MKSRLFVIATLVALVMTACGPKEITVDQLSKPMQSYLTENEKHNRAGLAPFTQYQGMTIKGHDITFSFLVDEDAMGITFAELKKLEEEGYEKMVTYERQDYLNYAVRIAHVDEIEAMREEPFNIIYIFHGIQSGEDLVADVTTEDIIVSYEDMRSDYYTDEDEDEEAADAYFDAVADSERFVLNLEFETRAANWEEVRRLIDILKTEGTQLTYHQAMRVNNVEKRLEQVEE